MFFGAAAGRFPEHQATPEHLFLDRRAFLATGAAAAALALSPTLARAQRIADLPDPTADLYPVQRNDKYVLDRPITDEKININYNNFYEFGTSKQIARNAQALKLRPWTVKIDGMVEKPQEIGLDDLIRKIAAGGAALSSPLRRGLGHGDPVVGLSRWPSWSNWQSRCRRRNISRWRPSWIPRWRRRRNRLGIRGPIRRV